MAKEKLSKFWENQSFLFNKKKRVDLNIEKFYNEFDINNLPEAKEEIKYAEIDYNSFFRAFKFAFKKVNKREFSHFSYGSTTDKTPIELFKVLTYYFFRDQKFYKSKLLSKFTEPSLDKGIIIAGVKGIGKTGTIKAFKELFDNADKYEVRNIENNVVYLNTYDFRRFQFFYGYELIKLIKDDEISENLTKRMIYIDDIFRESEANNFGNKINFTDFKLMRYNNKAKTLATMNYIESETAEDIHKSYRAKYGDLLADRFFESFNLIELKGLKSFRR